ncbi:uncharacterized protein LOC113753383 [Coffea eugenioides]|uniref:uncharacterized protein LOC113753383 n=1 Tax=Coffea eugenioides TaxID=49369 RepID=UPI000F60B0D8|nr:uncharacterized protein LOC113753383 [Coffea eugenioides]
MAETHIQVADVPEEESHSRQLQDQTPLLKVEQTHQSQNQETTEEDQEAYTPLDKTLKTLDSFLTLLGFKQNSILSVGLSWMVFLLIGFFLPVVILQLSNCPGCEKGQIKSFELDIVASQASLAAASLICVSHNLRKYGIRKFLFVDRYTGHVERFSDQYIQKISESVRLLVLWVLPCFILKTAREVIRMLYVHHELWWQTVVILLAFVLSSTYVTIIFLSSCILFYLVCNLQIIHFDDYGKLLERQSDVLILIKEHIRLRHYLSKISHRFRIYLILVFLIVTVSQFVTLFQTTGYTGIISFINGGDFAVSSIVQVAGITLCLNAAAKISHRAQGIGSLASQWHALRTCTPTDASQFRIASSTGSLEVDHMIGSLYTSYSESDLESLEFVPTSQSTPLSSYASSYHKRQALVTYLQSNPGGITVFGWTVDRGLINTIFFIQLSLVLFVLGKTVVFTSQ